PRRQDGLAAPQRGQGAFDAGSPFGAVRDHRGGARSGKRLGSLFRFAVVVRGDGGRQKDRGQRADAPDGRPAPARVDPAGAGRGEVFRMPAFPLPGEPETREGGLFGQSHFRPGRVGPGCLVYRGQRSRRPGAQRGLGHHLCRGGADALRAGDSREAASRQVRAPRLAPAAAKGESNGLARLSGWRMRVLERVGYLGPRGTFTEEAAARFFSVRAAIDANPGGKDEAVGLVPYRTIPELLADVQAGRLDKGVVPIENSIEGSVAVTLDVLVHEVDLQINGEVDLPIRHHLIAKPGVALNEIQEVLSHPQALAQCRRNLERLLPGVLQSATTSTAEAAKLVKASDRPIAALGTR